MIETPQVGVLTIKYIYYERNCMGSININLHISMGTNYKINTMKKSIYQHIADTYKDEVPTLEQVTAIIKEYAPNIYQPDCTFEQTVFYIYNDYKNFITSWTK